MRRQATISANPNKLHYGWRFYAVFFILLVCVLGLVVRMLVLSVVDRSFLVQQSESRVLRLVDIPAYRGMILDRNNIPLAISAPVDAIWINPQLFNPNPKQQAAIQQLLHLNPQALHQKARRDTGKGFIYLTRGLSPEVANKLKVLKIVGMGFQREYRRFYPSGELAAHCLGFTNIDDNGQEGLELAYNDWLKGTPGKREVVKDRLGQIVASLGIVHPPQEGHDLLLSLDSRIQYLAYTTLQIAVPKFRADAGSIVVLNAKNGEILAMTNYPSYNPNVRSIHIAGYRNRAVIDLFEPGSTMKAFSVASALASGKYHPDTLVDTRPGWMRINNHVIRDDGNYGIINLIQILQKSSNIGAAKITLSLPPDNLWLFLSKIGFGVSTQSGFPGEANGVLVKEHFKHPAELATIAYGYGMSTTVLQLTKAYAVLAAHGIKRPVTFLKVDGTVPGEPVINPALADQMLNLLQAVAEGGLGIQAKIPGYHIGGKTGTSYTADKGGYQKNRYNSSFIGIAPLSDPQLVVAVVLRGVQGSIHFGAQVSAPIFATVMGGALRYMNIPPDNL